MKISLIERLKVKNGVKRYKEKIGRLKPKMLLKYFFWNSSHYHYLFSGKK